MTTHPSFVIDQIVALERRRLILECLAGHSGELWHRELMAKLGFSSAVVSQHGIVLEKHGYIFRERSIRNGKQQTKVVLTARGQQALLDYQRSVEAILAKPKQVA